VDIARHHFLAGPGLARNQDRGVGRGDLLRELDDVSHGVVAIDELAGVVGDRRQHRSDHLGLGRQRDIFLGAGMNGRDRRTGVVLGAAGDDRHLDVLGFEAEHQIADVDCDIDHQEIGAFAGSQHRHGGLDALRMGDGRALVHGNLGRGGELPFEGPDDQQPHVMPPFVSGGRGRTTDDRRRVGGYEKRDFHHPSSVVRPPYSVL
jgi:hypothetical protein